MRDPGKLEKPIVVHHLQRLRDIYGAAAGRRFIEAGRNVLPFAVTLGQMLSSIRARRRAAEHGGRAISDKVRRFPPPWSGEEQRMWLC